VDWSRGGADFADEHLGQVCILIICGNEQHLIEGEVDGLSFKFLNYWRISPVTFSHIINHQNMSDRVFIADDLNYHKGSFARLFDTHHSILSANRYLRKSFTFGYLNKGIHPSFRVHQTKTNLSFRVHHRCLT
jgi:hypothetical protein